MTDIPTDRKNLPIEASFQSLKIRKQNTISQVKQLFYRTSFMNLHIIVVAVFSFF